MPQELDAQDSDRRIAEAHGKSQEAIRGTEEAKVEQERLKQENLKLQQQLAWRVLSDNQAETLANELQRFRGETTKIETAFGDPDSTNFGASLAEAIGRSGVKVVVTHDYAFEHQIPLGLSLRCAENHRGLIDAIAQALVRAGLAKSPVPCAKFDPAMDKLSIVVNKKPEHF